MNNGSGFNQLKKLLKHESENKLFEETKTN